MTYETCQTRVANISWDGSALGIQFLPKSPVIRNFFLGINKPPYPVTLFNSEEKALEWLKTFF